MLRNKAVAKRKGPAPSAEELVAELHPFNDWTAVHTSDAAAQIAELTRYLNHATQHPAALPTPRLVGDLLQTLGKSIRRLEQLLDQVARRMDSLAAEPGLRQAHEQQPSNAARDVAESISRQLSGTDADSAAGLGEQLDVLGGELERIAFQAQRLHVPWDLGSDAPHP